MIGQGRARTARPPSARPAAPRLKEKADITEEDQVQVRPQTGKVANIILANDEDQEDDADTYIVEEAPKDDLSLALQQTGPDTDVSHFKGCKNFKIKKKNGVSGCHIKRRR